MVTVGSIISGAFRLFREQPVAVAVWGVIYGVLTVGSSMLVMTAMRAQLASVGVGATSSLDFLQWMIPLYLALCVIGLVMTAAAFRAVMRPEASAAAFLRFGLDEVRLFILALFWIVINLVMYFVLVLLAGVIVAGIVGSSGGSMPGAILVGLLIALPIIALMIFIHIRLSPAIPLTIMRRKVIIGEAWRLTKGHFWALFAGYLVVVLILFAGYLLIATVTMGSYWAALAGGGFNQQSAASANAYRMSQMTAITPITVIGWLLNAAFGAVSYALWAGSVGTATKDLLGVSATDYATTFE